jgi:hypothetical protein
MTNHPGPSEIERIRAAVMVRADELGGSMLADALDKAAREIIPEGIDWRVMRVGDGRGTLGIGRDRRSLDHPPT